MKKLKKIVTILLAVAVLVSAVPFSGITISAEEENQTIVPNSENTQGVEDSENQISNVVLDWDFSTVEGNVVKDNSGNGNDGYINDGVTVEDGKAVFANGNEGISLPDDIFAEAGLITIEMTLQPSVFSNYTALLCVGDSAGEWVVMGIMADGSVRYALATNGDDSSEIKGNTTSTSDGNANAIYQSEAVLTNDREYDLKYVITPIETNVYIDSELAMTLPKPYYDTIGELGGPIVLGKATKWADPSYEGTISKFKITVKEDFIEDTVPSIQLDEVKDVEITYKGQYEYFSFTPEEDGYYAFYSIDATEYTGGEIYDAEMNLLPADYNAIGNGNFKIGCQMVAGITYVLRTGFSSYYALGTFGISVEKAKKVESIEVVSSEIEPLIENVDGWWDERYNYETGEYEEYYYYSIYPWNVLVQINYTDGTNITAYVDDYIDDSRVAYYENQYTNPWVVGKNNYITIEYMGATTQLPVTILSVEDFIATIPTIHLNETVLAVNRREASPTYFSFTPEEGGVYNFYSISDVDTWAKVFDDDMNELAYNDNGGDGSNFSIFYQMEAGTTYVLEAVSLDEDFDVCVKKVKEIESIEVISGEMKPLIENVDGYWSWRYNDAIMEDEEYFCYYTSFVENLRIQINYKDGSSTTAYVGDYVNGYEVDCSDNQYNSPWIAGGSNYITIEYMGATTQLPVTILSLEDFVETIPAIQLNETTSAVISIEGQSVYFIFTPEEDGIYVFSSMADRDTYGYIFDDAMSELAYDDADGEGHNFSVSYQMKAEETYILQAAYLGDSLTGAFDVYVEKLKDVESIEVVSGEFAPIVENTNGYWDEWEGFFYYELDLDNILVQINYTDGSSTTAYVYDYVDGYYVDCSSNQYANPWVVGGNNYITIEYIGATTQLPVIILSLEDFIGAMPVIQLNEITSAVISTEGESACFVFTPEVDGIYVFSSMADRDTYGYILDASMDELATDDDSGEESNFSVSYQMEAGVTYLLQARYYSSSNTGDFDICIEKLKDVESIEVISGEIEPLIENIDGLWEERYDVDTETYETFFCYSPDLDDVLIQINYTDGSSTMAYVYGSVDGYWVTVASDDQYNIPWVLGDDNYVTIGYRGVTTQLPVEIIPNPVASIEVVSGEVKLVENVGGWWDERYDVDTETYETFFYYYSDLDDVLIQINYTDGSNSTAHVHNSVDGYYVRCSNNQYDNPWVLGSDNYFTIEYLGATTQLPVTIIENPVESIQVITPPPIVCYPEEYPILTGMELVIAYTNGESQIVTITEENTTYDYDWEDGYYATVDIDGYTLMIEEIRGEFSTYYQASYLGETFEVEISYAELEIIDIAIENISWNGDGMIVTVTYNDDTVEKMTLHDFITLWEDEDGDIVYFGAYAKTLNGLIYLELDTEFNKNGEAVSYWIRILNEVFWIDVLQFEESGVIIDTTTDVVDSDTELFVKEQDVGNIVITDDGMYNLDTAVIYDIYLMKGDEVVQPSGMLTISLPVPTNLNGELCKVIYVDDLGNITELEAEFIDGYMVFQTDHFSYYAIVELAEEGDGEDDTGDILLGDINGDSVVDAGDAVVISRYDAGIITLTAEQMESGDVNGDGVVDAGDAVLISRYDAGFISSF